MVRRDYQKYSTEFRRPSTLDSHTKWMGQRFTTCFERWDSSGPDRYTINFMTSQNLLPQVLKSHVNIIWIYVIRHLTVARMAALYGAISSLMQISKAVKYDSVYQVSVVIRWCDLIYPNIIEVVTWLSNYYVSMCCVVSIVVLLCVCVCVCGCWRDWA